MPRTGLTSTAVRAKAVDLATQRLRSHGIDKVRLSAIAKDMNISHAALYAHFDTREALFDAVCERWLEEERSQTRSAYHGIEPTADRIRSWALVRYRLKRRRALQEPEIYRAVDIIAQRAKPYVITHLAQVRDELTKLFDGFAETLGRRSSADCADLLLDMLTAYHHPKLVLENCDGNCEARLLRVVDCALAGMIGGGGSADQQGCGQERVTDSPAASV